ncbi:MAG: tRNA-dihydrouridine synthase, partial [Pseudomonadota bacterium]
RDVLLEHLDHLHVFYGELLGARVARKHIGWYSKGLRGGAVFRHEINRVDNAREQRARVRDFFDAQDAQVPRAHGCAGAADAAADRPIATIEDLAA